MEDEKRVIEIDRITYNIILNALLNMKNELMNEKKETDLIDKVITKIVKSPQKPKGIFHKKRGDIYETR